MRITHHISNNNSGNIKTQRLKWGSSTIKSINTTTAIAQREQTEIGNRNSASSQYYNAAGNSFGQTGTGIRTDTQNTASDVTLAITGQLANGADNMALESYTIELFYAP